MQPGQIEAGPVTLQPVLTYQYPRSIPNPMVRDYVVWSLFNFTTMNCCCLGLLALVFSFKSRDCKVIGDLEGAVTHGKTAKNMNIAAMTGCIIIFVIITIAIITSAKVVKKFDDVDLLNTKDFKGK